ncbi:MAG: 3-hydroxyacyl-CoA dehydrogenase family protein [Acidimicrobiia bacterium]
MKQVAVVIGGGTMGAGIAQCLLEAGATVFVVESSEHRAGTARGRVEAGLRLRFKAAPDTDATVKRLLTRFRTRTELAPKPPADLVIEAVPEDLGLKARVLDRAERAYPGAAVLASNTSSLSIDKLARALERPERFCGMHFFNPVPRSEMVELVVGSATDAQTVAVARRWVQVLEKECIEVRDSPGFVTSRLGVSIGLEAVRMLEEQVATAEDIDRAMVLAYRFPIGPLRLTDLVGLDVRLSVAEYLTSVLGPRFEPPALLRKKVAVGELGKKTGRGFYSW